MTIVLDTSAAVEVVLQRPRSEPLVRVLADADLVLVPGLYAAEIANVFWKYYRVSSLSSEDCKRGLERGMSLPDVFADDRELYREAFAMACLCRASVYDMLYLVLARRNAATLLSLDVTLREVAAKHDVSVEY